MKSCSSERAGNSPSRQYFCQEPWNGIFSVRTNGDVVCCPCYAQARIGNIREATLQEIWNSEVLLEMRRAFNQGQLPKVCQNQLCPVVVGNGSEREA